MVILFSHRLSVVAILQALLEASLAFVAFLVAVYITEGGMAGEPLGLPLRGLTYSALTVSFLGVLGLYGRRARGPWEKNALRLFCSVFLAGISYYTISEYLFHWPYYRLCLPEAMLLSVAVILPFRGVLRFNSPSSRAFRSNVLVLGTGLDAQAVWEALSRSPDGFALVGFYPLAGKQEIAVPSEHLLPVERSLLHTVQELRVNEVIVAVREQRNGALPINDLLTCRLQGVKVTDLPAFVERVRGEVPVEFLKASWLIYGDGFRQGRGRNLVKRIFDVIAAVTILIPGIPIMLLAALAIWMESGRPIFYRQERVGLGGRPFNVVKFRSMRTDAEKGGKPQWAASNDPRVTRVGRFIRQTRIDELPQILNVLKGEMSFVGPRPERPYFVSQLAEAVPFYAARHSVKPGITGWAQVRYPYGATVQDAARKLQYDLYYVKNHTLMLDLVVLLETVRVVVRGEGAR